MHILFLTAEYPPQPGGVGDYTRRLGLTLAERGHQVEVLTSQDGLWTCYDLGTNERRTLGGAASWDWRCWPGVIDALRQLQPDVLHIQYQTGAYGMHPAINLLPWRLRALPGCPPIVVTFHDLLEPYLFPKAGPLRRWVTQRLARDADRVVVTNGDDAAQLSGKETRRQGDKGTRRQGDKEIDEGSVSCLVSRVSCLVSRVSVIPIGSNIPVVPPPDFEREVWRTKIGMQPHEILIAYFGLLGRSKGVDLLIDAAAQEPNWRLVLIGGEATAPQDRAYATEVFDQLQQLGLGERVLRTGQVDESAVSAYLLAADIVALPFRDGASFRRGSLLAALAHGCAVVTTGQNYSPQRHRDTESQDELPVLRDGEQVLLVPPDDAKALHDAIRRLADDESLRTSLSSRARELAARFGWEAIAERHEGLYEAIEPLSN